MKVQEDIQVIKRSGSFQEKGFTICATSKAFDILSSKMYSNIPLAIIRELSTNAMDSHKAANKATTPFDVHLPSNIEPFLSIRDYGTGISPNDIEEVYTTYFKSTRSGSNEYTGGFGLGSKTPFAYGKQFTVVSRFNGKKYTYICFKNEQNIPSITLLNTENTTDINGLEVTLSIEIRDVSLFITAAQDLYRFFPLYPKITGYSFNKFVKPKPVFSHNGLEVHDTYNFNSPTTINVVMGGIRYNVLTNPFEYNTCFDGYRTRLFIYLEVGEVEISASREEVQDCPATTNILNKKIREAATAWLEELGNKIKKDLPAFYHAYDLYKVFIESGAQAFLRLKNHSASDGNFQIQFYNGYACRYNGKKDTLNIHTVDRIYFNQRSGNMKFVYLDAPMSASRKKKLKILLRSNSSLPDDLVFLIGDKTKVEKDFGKDYTEFDDLVASVDPKTPNKLSIKDDISYRYAKVLNYTYWYDVDLTKTYDNICYVIRMEDGSIRNPIDALADSATTYNMNTIAAIAKNNNLTVFGLTPKKSNSLKKILPNFFDVIKKKYDNLSKTFTIDNYAYYNLNEFNNAFPQEVWRALEKVCPDTKNLRSIVKTPPNPDLIELINLFGIPKVNFNLPDPQAIIQSTHKKYPMLGLLKNMYITDPQSIIIAEYLKEKTP